MSDVTLKIFVDQVGRTVIGDLVSEDDSTISLKNPCTIFVQPNEQGQLQVQTVPTWTFRKNTIIDSDCAEHLDDKLKSQYSQIVTTFSAPDAPSEEAEPEVVKLFDD